MGRADYPQITPVTQIHKQLAVSYQLSAISKLILTVLRNLRITFDALITGHHLSRFATESDHSSLNYKLIAIGIAVASQPLNKGREYSMADQNSKTDQERIEDKNWEPSAPSAEEALKTEERSLDVGESGQFAPGGYYNQQGVNAPDRSALDPDNKSNKF